MIDTHLEAHVHYLEKQYASGNFLISGRKVPRTGGIIIATASNKEELMQIIAQDPFKQNDLADYEITEFIPTMTSRDLQFLKGK